jgi:NADP-dependent 3-hydroxy acid dehydrogenase YdfG
MDLTNGVALVTGASSGIGRATALALGAEGTAVALAARRAEQLESAAADIESAGGRALVVPTDVSAEAEVEAAVEATVDAFGRLDAVVANAGIGRENEVETMPTADYREMMGVNVDGTFFTTRESLPHLRDAGGHLVFVGSTSAKRPYPADPVYSATNAWIRTFAVSVAAQVGDADVAVSTINPTGTRTPFDAKYRDPNTERFPPGANPEPEDIADAIVFMLRQEPPNTVHELDFHTRDHFVD